MLDAMCLSYIESELCTDEEPCFLCLCETERGTNTKKLLYTVQSDDDCEDVGPVNVPKSMWKVELKMPMHPILATTLAAEPNKSDPVDQFKALRILAQLRNGLNNAKPAWALRSELSRLLAATIGDPTRLRDYLKLMCAEFEMSAGMSINSRH